MIWNNVPAYLEQNYHKHVVRQETKWGGRKGNKTLVIGWPNKG